MSLRSERGSAPVDFALVAPVICFTFTIVLGVVLASYQKSLLVQGASALAARLALADVSESNYEEMAVAALSKLGIPNVDFSLQSTNAVLEVELSQATFGAFRLEAVGFAAKES